MLEQINKKLKNLPDRKQPNYSADILESFNFKGDPNADNNSESDPLKKKIPE